MCLWRFFCNLSANLTVSSVIVALVGDCLTGLNDVPFIKALCDNITHALIGGLAWCIFLVNRDRTIIGTQRGVLEILSCTILSSLIDLDHFFAAKSLSLKDATRLKQRPFLHCSTIPLVTVVVLLSASYLLEYPCFKRGSLIILTAFTTHHIRDGTRRGMWFYPFGSTAPISYGFYIILTCMIPYAVVLIDRSIKLESHKELLDYTYVI